jgi:acyl dehydratase
MTHLKHLSDPKFPFQAMGTIHIRTVIEQVRPLRVDELVAYRCWVEGHREVDRGVEFDMMTEASVDGKVVSVTTMTMFRKGKNRKREGVRPPAPVHNHLNAHDASWSVDQSAARRYARLTGDINPIHLSTITAKALGFKGMMLHGMWIVGRACAMHPVQMMANNIRLESEFKLPVILPSDLRYRWWEEAGVLEMRVLDQNGTKPHMIARLSPMNPQSR